MKPGLKILNSREKKKFLEKLEVAYGIPKLRLDHVFLQTPKGRLYITNRDIEKIPLDNLRINSIGLYFANSSPEGLRLTIEGSQLIGKMATKNILELNKEQSKQWFSGEDINIASAMQGFVLIKHAHDFLGTGRLANGILHNFLGKERRIKIEPQRDKLVE
ncbi:MAG TPA: hypothetical protein VJH95_03440 [Candidatus Nanoarchaeia archaeon]|nr:hypothetical protein [Candidatus Nanoarchaeia archaeon]